MAFELIKLYDQVSKEPEAVHAEKKVDAMSVATVMEGFDEDDEDDLFFQAADDDVLPAPKFNEKMRRSTRPLGREPPQISMMNALIGCPPG